jgi:hypothetical protein
MFRCDKVASLSNNVVSIRSIKQPVKDWKSGEDIIGIVVIQYSRVCVCVWNKYCTVLILILLNECIRELLTSNALGCAIFMSFDPLELKVHI